MGLFNRKKKEQQPQTEERSARVGALSFNSISSFSNEQSMRLSAVYAAVNQISNSVGLIPIRIVSVTDGEKKDIKHALKPILNLSPDGKYNHFNYMKMMIESVMLKGNAYSYIERDEQLNVKALHYIDADYVTPMLQKDGSVKYIVSGFNSAINAEDMVHLYMHLDNTFRGISIIKYATNTLQSAKDAEAHSDNFFKSGANLSGILKTQSPIDSEKKKQIRESWGENFSSNKDKVSVAILPSGVDYTPISVNPEDAQLLESRQFNVIEIARFFNISPIKLFDLSEVSYSSMEATQIYYLQDTILPYTQMIEDEFNRKLFKPSQIGKMEVDFDYSELMSTSKEAEAKYYKELLVNGIMSINDCRSKLGLPKIDGKEGDVHWVQISYAPANLIAEGQYIKQASQDQNQNVDNKVKEDKEEEEQPTENQDKKDKNKK